jgi:hypothetical protein
MAIITLEYNSGCSDANAVTTAQAAPFRYLAATIPVPVNATFTQVAGGTLLHGTYAYRVAAISSVGGSTLAGTGTSIHLTATSAALVHWGAVAGAAGYRVYGRKAAAQHLLAEVGATTTYLDTGSVNGTTGADMPAADTSRGFGYTATIQLPAEHSKLFVSVPVCATVANFAVKTIAPGGSSLLTEDYDIDSTTYPRTGYKGGDNLKFFIGAGCQVVISGTVTATTRVWSAR